MDLNYNKLTLITQKSGFNFEINIHLQIVLTIRAIKRLLTENRSMHTIGITNMQWLFQQGSWYFSWVKIKNTVGTKEMIVLLEEASDVAFIVVEGMPDGTGALHSLHWEKRLRRVLMN